VGFSILHCRPLCAVWLVGQRLAVSVDDFN
jgi:hypothetical protein